MSESRRISIKEKGNFELSIGSGVECDLPMVDFPNEISAQHAILKRGGDRLFLKDLGSSQGTYINGRKIGGRWHEITLNDEVLLGAVEFKIGPTLLLGRDRVGIAAKNITFEIADRGRDGEGGINSLKKWFSPSKRILTNDVSISAQPGTLTGVMGPSGAGKTVLLNLLSGYLTPDKGQVTVGSFDIHKSFGLIKDIIGYVPQDDTLIPELTVRQSLHYCLRLRYPDMTAKVRQTLIEDVLEGMGFKGARLEKLLDTIIGSPERRGLSGGERKRVNIAHELVRNPLLLFLDEPTSGLSSVDSEHVCGLLRDICDTQRVTMLMTIHQPSEEIFNKLDNLLLLNRGGNVAYFGPANQVVDYFSRLSKEDTEGNPAEYVLRVLDSWDYRDPPEKVFLAEGGFVGISEDGDPGVDGEQADSNEKSTKKNYPIVHQFWLLLQRNIRVKLADSFSLLLTFSQPFIIALLLLLTFKGFQRDYAEIDRFSRVWFFFTQEYDANPRGVDPKALLGESKNWADLKENSGLIGESTAGRRMSLLFLIIASAVWFGVFNACREIVAERTILQREARGSLCISSYVMSKVSSLFLTGLIQTGILLGITTLFLLDTDQFLLFWGILILTTLSASCLGLLISSLSNTEQAALMALPIVIIPQMILGGLIRPFKFLGEGLHISDIALQKWAFKAMLICDSLEKKNIFLPSLNLSAPDPIEYMRFTREILVNVFFMPPMGGFSLGQYPIIVISLHAIIPLGVAYWWLRKSLT
jgi:ABC transport system ATP-binding/permease protein